ncbi:ribokinase [Microbacterium sp. SLBN-146]|uniref:ribokinase n=1 Tax=Microbacterium sp. SLBN-146 TaxID=2768457 RepID=UPI00116A9311|nr:ribokinase [Microbacterium sp. SLBN-146]TQJ31504.1 ribokinase [Microbacterium sp. SLBN-146]
MAGSPNPGHGRAPRVAVVGSLNLDLIARVAREPKPGETVLAEAFGEDPGGKGLNQAVAAARIASTALIGAVGRDDAGRTLLDFARRHDVDVDSVVASDQATGRALITLLPDGENTIVVAALANAGVTAADVRAKLDETSPTVVLVQFEIPADAVAAAADWVASADARLVVNPSPMRDIEPAVLAAADPLIVNVGEASEIAGTDAAPTGLAQILASRCRSVVVTAGADGAVVGVREQIVEIPAPVVDEVADSSGAGDAFAGTLGARLALGDELVQAARAAVEEASRIVSTPRARR